MSVLNIFWLCCSFALHLSTFNIILKLEEMIDKRLDKLETKK